MKKYTKWNAALFSASMAGMLIAGSIAFVVAADKDDQKEIPDHSTFQTCQPCHAEKHAMWEASGHGKAIGQIVANNPSAADCSGCHSSARPEIKPIAGSPDRESFHKASCFRS